MLSFLKYLCAEEGPARAARGAAPAPRPRVRLRRSLVDQFGSADWLVAQTLKCPIFGTEGSFCRITRSTIFHYICILFRLASAAAGIRRRYAVGLVSLPALNSREESESRKADCRALFAACVLHRFLHGDVKPDNFVLAPSPSKRSSLRNEPSKRKKR